MQDIETFIKKAAKYMAHDRPDLWDKSSARADLCEWIDRLTEQNMSIGTGGFVLTVVCDEEDYWEYLLSRSVLDISFEESEKVDGVAHLFDWVDNSKGFSK